MKRDVRKRRRPALIALVAMTLVAAACGDDDDGGATSGDSAAPTSAAATSETSAPSDSAAPTTSAASDTTAAPEGDSEDPVAAADRSAEFQFASSFGFNSFDPHKSPSSQGDQIFLRPVFDSLLTLTQGPDGVELGPQLATSFEIAADGMSIEFELRDDVTFQDGTPFDANAVKANIERALGPDSTVASILPSIASVEVVDPTHVVFHLKQPDPAVPWAMAIGTTGMMLSPAAFGNSDLATKPVGSGPFKLVSATKDADVVYERWDEHWDPDAALVQKLTISTISDGNVRFNGTRSGEYDAAYLGTPADFQSQSLTSEGFHWTQRLSPNIYGVLLNGSKAPFDDVRVRRAVSMALNRPEINEALLNEMNPPSFQAFADGFLGYNPSLDENPYDVDAARALVQEAGAEGASVSLVQPLTPPQDTLSEVVQQALADIGINAELLPLSPTEARPAWRTGEHHAFVAPIIGQPEPSSTLRQSYLGGDNPAPPPPELVTMADEALVLPFGSDERDEAYQEISAYLVENPIHVPLVQFSTVILTNPDVVGSDQMMEVGIADLEFRGVGISGS